jgi:hypothetical protein
LYRERSYVADATVAPIRKRVDALARRAGIADRRAAPLQPPPPDEQLPLTAFIQESGAVP